VYASVYACVCVKEGEREKVHVVCVCERERKSVCEREKECVREKEREIEKESGGRGKGGLNTSQLEIPDVKSNSEKISHFL